MDFKSIMSLFREDDWSGKLVGRLDEMLTLSGQMFSYTMGVVIEGENDRDPQVELFGRDKRINQLMRKVRRRVASRLSIAEHGEEVPTALIFMNAVKDLRGLAPAMGEVLEARGSDDDIPVSLRVEQECPCCIADHPEVDPLGSRVLAEKRLWRAPRIRPRNRWCR